MSQQYLIVKGCAGLGNRLITLSHATSYAKRSGRKMYVDWSDGQFGVYGKNVFSEYFDLKDTDQTLEKVVVSESTTVYPQGYKMVIDKGIYDVCIVVERSPFNKFPSALAFTALLKKMKNYWMFIDKKSPNPNADTSVFLKKLLSDDSFLLGRSLPVNMKQDVVVYADFFPPFDRETFLNNISLKPELLKFIDEYAVEHNLSEKTIGVHVRSTDKKPTATFEKLTSKLDSFMKNGYQLFLATDNPQVFEALKNRYNKVISYPKFVPQVKTEGIHQWALYNNKAEYAERILKESIIDMWLLSKCEYLFQQGNSSFSFISSVLHPDKQKVKDWLS